MPVGDLPLGRRQMVEIAKALYRKPRVLILDEPTSSLSANETRSSPPSSRGSGQKGMAILYISHRLNEVMALCDHVTVLKDGGVTADRPLAGTDAAGLVRLMVGRDPGDLFPRWQPSPSSERRRLGRRLLGRTARDVDLEIRRGEVLGIGGLVGQGQEDLLLGLYGAIPATAQAPRFNGAAGLPGTRAEGQCARPCLCAGRPQARGPASHPLDRHEPDAADLRAACRR